MAREDLVHHPHVNNVVVIIFYLGAKKELIFFSYLMNLFQCLIILVVLADGSENVSSI